MEQQIYYLLCMGGLPSEIHGAPCARSLRHTLRSGHAIHHRLYFPLGEVAATMMSIEEREDE